MIRLRLSGRVAALSLLAVAIASTPALAQHSGSEADQDACTPDVFRLCQAYIPDEAPIVACLKGNRERLSPACYRVFYSDASASTPARQAPAHHKRKRRHRAE